MRPVASTTHVKTAKDSFVNYLPGRCRALMFPILSIIILLSIGVLNASPVTASTEPIIIGILHSEKFPYADMMRNSYEMAVQTVNAAGGIRGRPLKIAYADDQGRRDAGEAAVKKLLNKDKAVILLGGYQSSNTLYMAGLAEKFDIPLLITTAADDRITQRKWKNIYRMNPPAQEYSKGVEDLLLRKIQPKTIAIVYENSPYGTGSALRMMWFSRENDIEIRKIIPYHKERANAEYFQKLLRILKENPPAVIYMVSYLKDAVFLVNELRKLQINSLLIGGAGGFTHHKFLTDSGQEADNLLTATLWSHQLSYAGTKEYYDQYLKQFSSAPDYHGAEAYSSIFIIADALRRAATLSAENIRTALDKTDMMTPFGPVKFQSYGRYERQNSLPTMVLQVIGGRFEIVWPETISTTKFSTP